MRWTPLAVSCSYAFSLLVEAAFSTTMRTTSGVPRALVGSSSRRLVDLSLVAVYAGRPSLTMALPLQLRLPPASPAARRVFQQQMMSSSTSQQQHQQHQQQAPDRGKTAAVGRRRAASQYVPSDFRGVWGGAKGKWKARLVSKGQLRQLGTFESEIDAARAYNKAARSLHGSAAKLNLLPEPAAAPQESAAAAAAAATAAREEAPATAAAATTTESAVGAALANIELEAAAARAESRGSGRSSKSESSVVAREEGGKETAINERVVGTTAETTAAASSPCAQAEVEISTCTTGTEAVVVEASPQVAAATAGAPIAGDWYHPRELDFRDLEEIPEIKGSPLWDTDPELESTWATVVETEIRGIDRGGVWAGCDDGNAAATVGEGARARSTSSSPSVSAISGSQTLKVGGAVNESLPAGITEVTQKGRGEVDPGAAPVTTTARKEGRAPKEGVAGEVSPADDESLSAVALPTPLPATGVDATESPSAAAATELKSVMRGGLETEPSPPPTLASATGADLSTSTATSTPASAPVVTSTSKLDPPLPAPLPPRLAEGEKEEGVAGSFATVSAVNDANSLVLAGEVAAEVASDTAAGGNGAGQEVGRGGVESIGASVG
ncbi:unnamed protein product, partial [Hapterophycus canaliculatus]